MAPAEASAGRGRIVPWLGVAVLLVLVAARHAGAGSPGDAELLARMEPDGGGAAAIDFLFRVAKALAGIVTAAGLLILLRWVTGGSHFIARPTERAPGSDVGMVLGTVKEVMSRLKDDETTRRDRWSAAAADPEARRLHAERIVGSIDSGLVAFDNAGRVTLFNRGAERILGFAAPSAVGRLVPELFDESDPVRAIVEDLLGDLHSRKRFEWERADADVGARWLAASSSMIRDHRGVPQGGFLLIDDLTEAKERRDAAGLADRLTAVDEVSAGLAHELEGPLRELLDRARQLRAGDDGILAPAESIEATVGELLALARPTRPVRERVDLDAMLTGVMDAVRARATPAAVALELDLGGDLPRMRLEAESVRSAFLHCAGNAVEAMEPAGGGTLTIASRTTDFPRGDDGERRPGVRVSFRDTGPGIPEADRLRVFTPFFTTKPGARGLGLPTVHRTVAAHGGRVHLHSRNGAGTELVLELPAEEAK